MQSDQLNKGSRTRSEILDAAVNFASAEGLEGLTIGSLAKRIQLSKSGLFAHFGSKEGLQLATVGRAAEIFAEMMISPFASFSQGIELLHQYLHAWCLSVENSPNCGGCFFYAASAEFDGRPGAVRELIAKLTSTWLDLLQDCAQAAVDKGEMRRVTDCAQLAFECHALVQEANWAKQLLGRVDSFDRARNGMDKRLNEAATKKGQVRLSQIDKG